VRSKVPPYRDGRGGKFLTGLTIFSGDEDVLRGLGARSKPPWGSSAGLGFVIVAVERHATALD
jgi:hypothetical protein